MYNDNIMEICFKLINSMIVYTMKWDMINVIYTMENYR